MQSRVIVRMIFNGSHTNNCAHNWCLLAETANQTDEPTENVILTKKVKDFFFPMMLSKSSIPPKQNKVDLFCLSCGKFPKFLKKKNSRERKKNPFFSLEWIVFENHRRRKMLPFKFLWVANTKSKFMYYFCNKALLCNRWNEVFMLNCAFYQQIKVDSFTMHLNANILIFVSFIGKLAV